MRAPALAVLLVAAALAGCTQPAPPAPAPPAWPPVERPAAGFNPIVRVATDRGDFYVEVYQEMAPRTAAAFLDYVQRGFYEGQKVDHVEPGFIIQMGDPTTRDPTKPRNAWGSGDPRLPRVEDEPTPALRHDRPGRVSLYNTGPGTGSSQFFITLSPQPRLDDHYTIFGQVVAGMATVERIATTPTGPQGIPTQDVTLTDTDLIERDRKPEQVVHGVAGWTYQPVVNTSANRTAQLGLVVHNTGNTRVPVEANLTLPAGWVGEQVQPAILGKGWLGADTNVSANGTAAWLFMVRVPANATPGEHPLAVTLRVPGHEAKVPVVARVRDLGAPALNGTNVSVNYIGFLRDGRVFDTSRYGLASNASLPVFPPVFQLRPERAYTPLGFQVGSNQVIRGFSLGTAGLQEGEHRTVFVKVEHAYGPAGPQNNHRLAGRELVFSVELVDVQ